MKTDRREVVASNLAAACEASDHAFCESTQLCDSLRSQVSDESSIERSFTHFDAGQIRLEHAGEMPQHGWSMAALLRTVADLITSPPGVDPLKRMVMMTTALARAAERGYTADAVVRTCLGQLLVRHVVLTATSLWHAERAGELGRSDLDHTMRAWLELIDCDAKSLEQSEQSFPSVVAAALSGATGEQAREWIDTAAVAHIAQWRIDDYLKVERSRDDCLLPAGLEATRWVFERFTHAVGWSRASLNWELVFNSAPRATAERLGMPIDLLMERRVPNVAIIRALERKLSSAEAELDVITEIVEAAVARLSLVDLASARLLTRQAFESSPGVPALRLAYAFCSIPEAPNDARATLMPMQCHYPEQVVLRAVNLATACLFEKDLEGASRQLSSLSISDASDAVEGWLWDAPSAYEGKAKLRFMGVTEWVETTHELFRAVKPADH